MLFSKSLHAAGESGFYFSDDKSAPIDAISVSDDDVKVAINLGSGWTYDFDGNGGLITYPPTADFLLIDAVEKKMGYLIDSYEKSRQLPVAYLSTIFQADDASQAVLSKTLAVLVPIGSTPAGFYWLDLANNQVPMTITELQGLSSVMFDQGWAAFQHLQNKKAALNAAATVADVQLITW